MSENDRTLSVFSGSLDRRDFLRLAGMASAGLALAACGAETSPSPGGATGPDFKLGVVLPYSKVYAQLGDSITNGMLLYFDKVGNQAGNRKIKIIKEDEEDSPAVAVTRTRKLVEQDQVDMITGYVLSPSALNNRDYLDQTKTPTLVSNAGVDDISRAKKSTYIFRTSFSNWQPNSPMGKYVADNVSKRVLLVYADYSAGAQTARSFKESYTGAFAAPDVKTPFPNTTGDFSAAISRIQAVNPGAIYVFLSGTDAINFLKQANQVGLFRNIKAAGSGFFVEQDVLAAIGDAAPVGAISGLHWALTLDTKENQDFVAAYKKKYQKEVDVFAVQGFDTGRVIVEALNAVKGSTSNKDAFLKAIAAVSFKSPRGDFKFDSKTNNVINTIYVRELVKDPKLGFTHKVRASFPNIADPGQ
jgi:branched-chain amino acid transport system substrate-binding protein